MQKTISKVGYWSALIAFVGAVGYVVSVPLQIFNVVTPLQNGVIAFGFSLIITVPFLLSMIALHYTVEEKMRFWTHIAVSLAVIYVTYCALNYVVQLVTVIPAGYYWTFEDQQGTQGPLSVLNQTPHSLFWDIDGLGYIFFNLATIFAIPVFARKGIEKWVRGFFIANGLITPFFAIAYFYPVFSPTVLMLGAPWAITVPGSLLSLALFFRNKYSGK